jgi:hypothetical protein
MLAKLLTACRRNGDYLVVALALALLSFFTYGYLKAWAVHFTSDHALIGLMSKYIAEQGERPIFVWSVGYQGMFMEGYLTALIFHLFGTSVANLNIAPALYLWIALMLFYVLIRGLFNRPTAALALLLVVASSPTLYLIGMRALPNFSSSFLLGMLMLLFYERFFDRVHVRHQLDRRALGWIFLFGVTSGFALYTFIISAYFLVTAALCSFIFYLRSLKSWSQGRFLHHLLIPSWGAKSPFCRLILTPLFVALLLISVTGAVLFVKGTQLGVVLMKGKRPVEPLHLMLGGLMLHVTAGFVVNFFRHQGDRIRRVMGGLTFLAALLIGFSPSLYYWFVLGGRSVKGAAASGTLDLILKRAGILYQSLMGLLNLPHESHLASPLKIAVLGAAGWFGYQLMRTLKALFKDVHAPPHPSGRSLIVYLLPVAVVPMFLLSSAVVDQGSGRYLSVFAFVFATMLALAAARLMQLGRRGQLVAVTALALIVTFNARSIITPWKEHEPAKSRLDQLTETLRSRGIEYAYGDYWSAYLINFYTNEKVIIEPSYSNYAPHYGPRVSAQAQVGYIARLPKKMKKTAEDAVEIHGTRYTPEGPATVVGNEWEITLLKRR